jgi:hypothetical protein
LDRIGETESPANGSIGAVRGSNAGPAHFTLTFAALDFILTSFLGCESEADAPRDSLIEGVRMLPGERAVTKERHDE